MENPFKKVSVPASERAENVPAVRDRDAEFKFATEIYDSITSRPEYAEGTLKLDFHYTFSTGETLSATEDDDGRATIVIKKGEEVILDLGKLLSLKHTGYSFRTPSGASNNTKKNLQGSSMWGNSQQTVYVGDMRGPKDIFFLLHEMGHVQDFDARSDESKYRYQNTRQLWVESTGALRFLTSDHKGARRELAKEISKEERNASANALKMARKVKQEFGINLLEGFSNLHEVQEIEYGCLAAYRLGMERELISSDEGAVKDLIMRTVSTIGLSTGDYGKEQEEFMDGLFDKKRLGTIMRQDNG